MTIADVPRDKRMSLQNARRAYSCDDKEKDELRVWTRAPEHIRFAMNTHVCVRDRHELSNAAAVAAMRLANPVSAWRFLIKACRRAPCNIALDHPASE